MFRKAGAAPDLASLIYPFRILGMALAFPAVAVVLYQQAAPLHLWVFAIFNGALWPHVAYMLAQRDSDTTSAEYRNLMTDSLFAGLWVPLMSFNVLPVVVILTMASVDNMMMGGWRQFSRGFFVSLLGVCCGVVWAHWMLPNYTPQLAPDLVTVSSSIPVLTVYPLALAVLSHSFARRLSQQISELEKLSHTDELSQLPNRRFWEECVFREYQRHKRSDTPLSLLMIDIDRFKLLNDEHGHAAGDQVIREVSDLLADCARLNDVAGRFGGDEFSMLLPDTDLAGAMLFAERIRLAAQSIHIKPWGLRCTLSIGVADAGPDINRYDELIERADSALYQAKREGRNVATAFQMG